MAVIEVRNCSCDGGTLRIDPDYVVVGFYCVACGGYAETRLGSITDHIRGLILLGETNKLVRNYESPSAWLHPKSAARFLQ
jgi:hypothetical protein